MSDFGDYDPDDAWDASDPVHELLAVLARRVLWLVDHRDDIDDRIHRIVDDIETLRRRVLIRDL
jgi:hypothetical protein